MRKWEYPKLKPNHAGNTVLDAYKEGIPLRARTCTLPQPSGDMASVRSPALRG